MTLQPESWTYVVRSDVTDEQIERAEMARRLTSSLMSWGVEEIEGNTASWTDETRDSVVVTTGLQDEVGSYDRLSMSISNGTRTGLNLFVMPSLPSGMAAKERALCMLAMLRTAIATPRTDVDMATALPAALRNAIGVDSDVVALPTPWSGSFSSGDRSRPLRRAECDAIDRLAPRVLCTWPMDTGSRSLSFSSIAISAVMDGEEWPRPPVSDMLRCSDRHSVLIGGLQRSALDESTG